MSTSPLPLALPRLLHTGSLSSGLFSASALGVSCSAPNLRDYVRTHHRHHHPKPPLSPGSLPCKSGMFGTFTTLSVLSHGAGLFICIHLKSFFFFLALQSLVFFPSYFVFFAPKFILLIFGDIFFPSDQNKSAAAIYCIVSPNDFCPARMGSKGTGLTAEGLAV